MDTSSKFRYYSNMTKIEEFNLYGERDAFPDVVHCETIQTRSLIHDWDFKPHRHLHLHQVLAIDTGAGTAQIEDRRQTLTRGVLINLPAGCVHGFQFDPGTQGWVVTLDAAAMADGLRASEGVGPLVQRAGIYRSDNDIRQIIQLIFAQYTNRSFGRAHVLRGLSAALIGLVARVIATDAPQARTGDHKVLRRFEALLEEHLREHLGVAAYAARLGVSPTHLSRVVRAAKGVPASALIEARVIREARRYLAFSNLHIAEIAYQLGYGDPAYFSRVFRRATGLSPRAFRQSLMR